MIRRLQTAYAITVFVLFNRLIEYGDDQLADLGGDDE